jgi:predicted carbohydrate-binding protein with CBM5 and CBM33 domain
MAKRQKNRQHNGQKTEEQATQWPKEKGQKVNQRSTKHTHKIKDRTT